MSPTTAQLAAAFLALNAAVAASYPVMMASSDLSVVRAHNALAAEAIAAGIAYMASLAADRGV